MLCCRVAVEIQLGITQVFKSWRKRAIANASCLDCSVSRFHNSFLEFLNEQFSIFSCGQPSLPTPFLLFFFMQWQCTKRPSVAPTRRLRTLTNEKLAEYLCGPALDLGGKKTLPTHMASWVKKPKPKRGPHVLATFPFIYICTKSFCFFFLRGTWYVWPTVTWGTTSTLGLGGPIEIHSYPWKGPGKIAFMSIFEGWRVVQEVPFMI